jgi:5-methyltetrahydrofolate--homocysteine methyltransferase
VVTTNTFGANPARLGAFGLAEQTGRFNNAGLDLARAAARRKGGFVVLSLGPTGSLLPPLGNADEGQIDRAYALQLDSIDRPVDLVLVETVFDLREGLVALAAARRAALAPVGVSVTFDRKPKGFFTSMGDAAAETIVKLEEAGADVVGLNCTLASTDMLELAREVRELTALPLVCQPNAGLPRMTPQGPVYEQTASEYARDAALMIDAGVNAVGGCCGTTPEFISGLVRRLVEYR